MTAIAGVVHAGRVYIGGDSAGIAGYQLTSRADAKVFRTGPFVFGFTTSFRMGQLIRWSLTVPEPEGDLERFMCTTFIDRVRECLKDGGWATKNSDREEGGTFLVGTAGRLFTVESDYQVGEAADGYAAVGAGDGVALGALYATRRSRMRPEQRITTALAAAERFNAAVRGPFVCLAEPESGDPA